MKRREQAEAGRELRKLEQARSRAIRMGWSEATLNPAFLARIQALRAALGASAPRAYTRPVV